MPKATSRSMQPLRVTVTRAIPPNSSDIRPNRTRARGHAVACPGLDPPLPHCHPPHFRHHARARWPGCLAARQGKGSGIYAGYNCDNWRPDRADRLCWIVGDQEPVGQGAFGRGDPVAGAAWTFGADRYLGAGCGRDRRVGRAGLVEPSEPQAGAVGQAGLVVRAGAAVSAALGVWLKGCPPL